MSGYGLLFIQQSKYLNLDTRLIGLPLTTSLLTRYTVEDVLWEHFRVVVFLGAVQENR